jgi:hypothetical protein
MRFIRRKVSFAYILWNSSYNDVTQLTEAGTGLNTEAIAPFMGDGKLEELF